MDLSTPVVAAIEARAVVSGPYAHFIEFAA
jgi:hypothetical protein